MASAPAGVRTVGAAISTFGTSIPLGPRSSSASPGLLRSAGLGASGSEFPLLPVLLSRLLLRSDGNPASSRRGP
eukprot:6788046-Alexandrium_andersonii.AAC.1